MKAISFIFKPLIQGFLGAIGVLIAGAIAALFIVATPVGDIIVETTVKSIVESSVMVGVEVGFPPEIREALLKLIEGVEP